MSAPLASAFLAAMGEADAEAEVERITASLPPASPPSAEAFKLSATVGEGLLFPVGPGRYTS